MNRTLVNNLAETAARWDAGSIDAFVANMNARAAALKLTHTKFADVSGANPNQATAYECLAFNAYGASQSRKGDLASAKALTLLPKAGQTSIKHAFTQAKSSPQTAQQLAQQC